MLGDLTAREGRGLVLVLALAVLLACPIAGAAVGTAQGASGNGGPSPSAAEVSEASPAVPVNFTPLNSEGSRVDPSQWGNYGYNLSPDFWGTTVTPRSPILPDETSLIDSTPNRVILWPGAQAGEDYDPQNNTIYTAVKASGSTPASHEWNSPPTNESEFVNQVCRPINCQAIFQVPAETGNVSMATWIVNYTENTLGFHPAYWEIGNEPSLWNLFDVPWTEWPVGTGTRSGSAISAVGYADLVANFSAAMRAVDPSIQIIGLPTAGRAQPNVTAWVAPTVAIAGNDLSGVAYHSYPAGAGVKTCVQLKYRSKCSTTANILTFYSAINGTSGLFAWPSGGPGPGGRIQQVETGIEEGATEPGTVCNLECAQKLQIFVTEFGDALSHRSYGKYANGFPGALDFAAQVVEAIDLNVTNIDVFASVLNTSNSWFYPSDGVSRPSYTLWSEILNHLGTVAFQSQLVTPSQDSSANSTWGNTTLGANLFSISTADPEDANRGDVLAVNLNLSTNVSFAPRFPLTGGGSFGPDVPTEMWLWQGSVLNASNLSLTNVVPSTVNPTPIFYPDGVPTSFVLPAQSVAVFEAYPGGGAPVEFSESGLQDSYAQARWFLSVGDSTWTVNDSISTTLFLPPGTYSVGAQPILLKDGVPISPTNHESRSEERLEPFMPSTIQVGTAALIIPVRFQLQWATNLSSSPSSGGFITPAPNWWNATQSLMLDARPAIGQMFVAWYGYGPGNYSGLSPQMEVTPSGSIRENAVFEPAFPVTFGESGLPAGVDWGVSVRRNSAVSGVPEVGYENLTSSMNLTSFDFANGTYAFSVDPVYGFRELPSDSAFTVAGGAASVSIQFIPVSVTYPVNFVETGLPVGTSWSITARIWDGSSSVNLTESTTGTVLTFSQGNGSYGYAVGMPAGYRASPPAYGYNVSGSSLTVPISFHQVVYDEIWEESGLGANITWTVLVNSSSGADPTTQWLTNAGAWTSAQLPNGSYTFFIPDVQDFVPAVESAGHPSRGGSITIDGAGAVIEVNFIEAKFAVSFALSDGPAAAWQVRIGSSTVSVTGTTARFAEPNGSYTFDVIAPEGYLANPSHGVVWVNGSAVAIPIEFRLAAPPPTPSVWSLAGPAAEVAAVCAVAGVVAFLATGYLVRRRDRRTP